MKALLPLLCLIMLSACLTNPSRTEYTYYQDAKLAEDYPHVLPGDSLVFLRYHQAEDKENVMDDEYAEALYFQVPDTTQFLYEGVLQLQELKVRLYPYCFCLDAVGNTIEGGKISGTQRDGIWRITADIDLRIIYAYDQDSTYLGKPTNRSFSATFHQEAIPTR
ncbi:MAG: hypothetical protein RIC30_07275 [Marinoscillum sp.]|uniref:hypothetical protein n=1 Tax=Marinoscillum sp. TaxID=2024838 RepID=UPI0032FCFA8F